MISRVKNRLRRINAKYYPKKVFFNPEWLVLGVNNLCNLHCRMCDVGTNYSQSNFYTNLMGSKPLQMPIELFRRIVDQAKIYYPKVKLGYAFTEPLIYTHLQESLDYAGKCNIYTSITTNGLGLKKWSGAFDKVGLNELNVSLDGPEDIHNSIRGNNHSYSLAIQGIKSLSELNTKIKINIYCVITEWNIGRLRKFIEELKPLPLSTIGLMHSNFTTGEIAAQHNKVYGDIYPATISNTSGFKFDSTALKELWAEITEIKSRNENFEIKFTPNLKSFAELETYYWKPQTFVGRICTDTFSNMMIKSNGDVIPAHGRCYNLTVGNLYSQNLREIWNSSAFIKFRTHLSQAGGLFPACSRCCSSFVR